ncbi:MAG: hypothetical protein COB12_05870 [Flavobacterium sp.]|nr:MAG: hypothetical protein COB12_05870 [Flavobacterium sp.]
MKRITLIILSFSFSHFLFAQNEDSIKLVGFEIYLLNEYNGNPNSFWYLDKTELRKFKRKFKEKKLNQLPNSICHDYLNWNKITLFDKPFLSKSDIEYYSWNDYTVVLTQSGIEKIKLLKGNVQGIPFAIVINGVVQFGGKFRWIGSSQMNDRVYTSFKSDFKEIKIMFMGCGEDPRNTPDFRAKLNLRTE